MVRKSGFDVERAKRASRGTSALPIVSAVGLFALVAGAALWLSGRSDADATHNDAQVANSESAKPDAQPAVTKLNATKERLASLTRDEIFIDDPAANPPVAAVASPPKHTASAPVESAAPAAAVDPAAERRTLLASHLEAGEFGPALDLARDVAEQAERSSLLAMIADAQLAAGEFDAARLSTRRIPLPAERSRAHRERAAEESLAGGGSLANFQQLIDLIQNETGRPPDGQWFDIDSAGGTIDQYDTGVRVDPHGMLAVLTRQEQTRRLEGLGLSARQADLNEDMARPSDLRLVSLTRLELEVARRLAAGQPVLETMQHLAGLSAIRYVFVYPDESEVVIGGPAEGWRYSEQGFAVGSSSGTPTLHLDDFVTVLRVFSPGGSSFFNCLIVPRQEGLRSLKEYVEKRSGPLSPATVPHWARALQEKLGPQDAVFNGIPTDSRVARVMLEADYRMKLIGIGRLDGGSEIPSYFDLLTPTSIQENPPQLDALRWWLSMKYDAVLHSTDRDVFEVVGSSVRCQSENELVDAQGNRIHTGQADPANQQFAQNFTGGYAQLARRDLVFADLQNIFDLALVAALFEHERIGERAGWTGGVFAPAGAYEPAHYAPPATVMTAVNHRVYGGRDIIVQVAGGVRADAASVLRDDEVYQQAVRLGSVAPRGRAPQLPEGRWWWDAAGR